MKKKKAKAKPKARAKSRAKARVKRAAKKARRPAKKPAKKIQMASRRPKRNEVPSDGTLRSSLTANVIRSTERESRGLKGGQAGDLQGLSDVRDADSESVEELLEDGQAFEAEVVEGVEDVPDEAEVPRRGRFVTPGEPSEG